MRCLGLRRERILRWISIRTVRMVDGCAGLFVWPLFHCIHFTPPLTLLFLPLVHECEPSSFPAVSPSRIPACAIHVICMSVRASHRILPSLSYRASIFFLYLPIFLSFSSTCTVIQLLPVCYSQRLVAFLFFSYFNSQFFFLPHRYYQWFQCTLESNFLQRLIAYIIMITRGCATRCGVTIA